MFRRIDGLRTLVLGQPGSELQRRLNALVIAGLKTGTSSVDDGEYGRENEEFETVGERQWLIDGDENPIAQIEFTAVDWVHFESVGMEFVRSEGEGYKSVQDWQDAHRKFWADIGFETTSLTPVICYRFKLIRVL